MIRGTHSISIHPQNPESPFIKHKNGELKAIVKMNMDNNARR